MDGFGASEQRRPEFVGKEIHSPVTGMPELYFAPQSAVKLRIASYVVLFWALVAVWALLLGVYVMEAHVAGPIDGTSGPRGRPSRAAESRRDDH